MVLALNGFCLVHYKLLGFEVWLAGAKGDDVIGCWFLNCLARQPLFLRANVKIVCTPTDIMRKCLTNNVCIVFSSAIFAT